MNTLIIEASSNFLYIAIRVGEHEFFSEVLEGRNNHSEHIIPLIEKGLHLCCLDIKNFDRIIVGIGPGSYTGSRIALTVAKMFSWSADIPLYTASSLDILASGNLLEDGVYITSLHAKKNFVYANVIDVLDGKVTHLVKDIYLSLDDFTEKIISKYPEAHLINDGKYSFNSLIITENLPLTKVEDIHGIVPNYLRSVL